MKAIIVDGVPSRPSVKKMASKKECVDERRFAEYVASYGDEAVKLNIHGRIGYPDRLIIMDEGVHFFIEFKRVGGKTRKAQDYVIAVLKRKRHGVYVCETFEEAVKIYYRYREHVARIRAERLSKEGGGLSSSK